MIPVRLSEVEVMDLCETWRKLLNKHLHTGWFDPGFHGTATLEVKNMAPWTITLKRGQPIVQLALLSMSQEPRLSYKATGRYNGQEGQTPAR